MPNTAPRARSIGCRSIACTVLLMILAVANRASADPILNSVDGHYFDVVDGTMDWFTANQFAHAQTFMGAHGQLVSITTAQENQFLTQAFGSKKLALHWTGGMLHFPQIILPGDPLGPPPLVPPPTGSWVSGATLAYTNWAGGGPVYLPGDLGRIVFGHEVTGDGQDWIDFPSSTTASGYVVEFAVASTPEPATLTMLGSGALALGGFAGIRRWRARHAAVNS